VPLTVLLRRFRSPNDDDLRSARVYRAHVQEVIGRVRATCESWAGLREVEPDNARLANTAAVNRWELLRLADEIERLRAPRLVGGLHRELAAALADAARACQLLATGYRSHKSEAVCDGQALLVESAAAVEHVEQALQRT
jgi:hypothetical protein